MLRHPLEYGLCMHHDLTFDLTIRQDIEFVVCPDRRHRLVSYVFVLDECIQKLYS
jgi:hypothetical protein